MAIEGNDWWAIAGAAAGGLAAGMVGSKLLSQNKEDPYFVNLRRIYVKDARADEEPESAVVSLWEAPGDGYMVRQAIHGLLNEDGSLNSIPDLTDWIGYFEKQYKYGLNDQLSGFDGPEDAMIWADSRMKANGFRPVTKWSGPLGKEIKLKE
jgi:hypothetical protein